MNRVALLMKKIGCSAVFDENRNRIPITILQLEHNVVLSTNNINESAIVRISFGEKKNLNKPQSSYFEKLGVSRGGRILEFRIDRDGCVPNTTETLRVSHFSEGQYVDVIGNSIGKGFSGVMKRHNFPGLRASHGVSLAHRSGGSTGQCQDPGKTFKGRKMPGQLGNKRVTTQNLVVQLIDSDKNIIALKGSVPGCKNSYILVRDAIKKSIIKKDGS